MAKGNTWKRLKINCQVRKRSGIICLHSDWTMYPKMLTLSWSNLQWSLLSI